MEILGHSTITLTANTYAHVSEALLDTYRSGSRVTGAHRNDLVEPYKGGSTGASIAPRSHSYLSISSVSHHSWTAFEASNDPGRAAVAISGHAMSSNCIAQLTRRYASSSRKVKEVAIGACVPLRRQHVHIA